MPGNRRGQDDDDQLDSELQEEVWANLDEIREKIEEWKEARLPDLIDLGKKGTKVQEFCTKQSAFLAKPPAGSNLDTVRNLRRLIGSTKFWNMSFMANLKRAIMLLRGLNASRAKPNQIKKVAENLVPIAGVLPKYANRTSEKLAEFSEAFAAFRSQAGALARLQTTVSNIMENITHSRQQMDTDLRLVAQLALELNRACQAVQQQGGNPDRPPSQGSRRAITSDSESSSSSSSSETRIVPFRGSR